MSASLLKQQSIDRLVDRLEHIFPETDWFGVNIERHVNFCFSQLALNSTQFAILCKRNIIIKLFLWWYSSIDVYLALKVQSLDYTLDFSGVLEGAWRQT